VKMETITSAKRWTIINVKKKATTSTKRGTTTSIKRGIGGKKRSQNKMCGCTKAWAPFYFSFRVF
jgi:hypothetical protein